VLSMASVRFGLFSSLNSTAYLKSRAQPLL
jgi:hypothetical protein